MKNGERVETLIKLGLTLNQARAYMGLAQFGPAGAKKLSDASKITRQDIYRVMLSLEQTGIIEKLVGKPTIYKATPIDQAAKILLERKNAEQKELRKKTKELIHSLENNHTENENEQQSDTHFIMVPGKEVIMQKLAETLQKTEKGLQVVTSRERFSSAIVLFKDIYLGALERGVTIQIATQKHAAEKQAYEVIQNLESKNGFQLKYFDEPPEAIVSIFDGKEVSVTVSATANQPKTSALWSNDASFIALAQHYFTKKWNESTEIPMLVAI